MSSHTVIGLEIHISIFNQRKAFSHTPINSYSWITLGFPGTLPTLSFDAVKSAIRLSHALNMNINSTNITFDRKNYFYYDLPRGFQLTQFFNPIGKTGVIELSNGKKIRIKQLHLEEDTAKQTKHGHSISLSFERLGNPLIEIVTEPDFSEFEEVKEFLNTLKGMCIFLGISSCKYECGEMRVDLNVSHRLKEGGIETTPKSEVKNLNSIITIEKSIKFFENNDLDLKKSYTYTWVDKTSKCEVLREKSESKQYFYIPEANIPPLSITDDEMKGILDHDGDFHKLMLSLKEWGLSEKEIHNLMQNYDIFVEIRDINLELNNWKKSYIWRASIIEGLIEDKNYNLTELIKLIKLIESAGNLPTKIAKEMIKEVLFNQCSGKEAFKLHKISQINNEDDLLKKIYEVLGELEDQLEVLSKNMDKLKNLVISKIMSKTKGSANPKKTVELFEKNIVKYLRDKNIII